MFFRLNDFFSLRGRRFPFLGLVLAAVVGILVEEYFSFPSSPFFLLTLFLGVLLELNLWKNFFSSSLALKLFFLFAVCCFATIHAWQWQEASARQLQSFLKNNDDEVLVEGTVTSEVKTSSKENASFILQADHIIADAIPYSMPVAMWVHWEGPPVTYGDRVRLRGFPQAPSQPRNPGEFDGATWLARKEIATELTMDPSNPGEVISSAHGCTLLSWTKSVRHRVEESITLGIEKEHEVAQVIQGITLGMSKNGRSRVAGEKDIFRDFQLTGTMHLFAVSGLHVGMLAMIICFFLQLLRLPRTAAVIITLLLLFFYVAMTGFRIGSLRAFLMTSVILLGLLFYRRPQMINTLASAAFCLLLVETNLLFSMGWQFSFSVVLAILLFASPFQKKLQALYTLDPFVPQKFITPFQRGCQRAWHHLAQLIAVSAAAWIGALAPTFFYFHFFSFSSLGANVVAVPLAFVIFTLAVISLICGFLSPWVATIFNNTNWLCTKLLLFLVHGCTLLPTISCSMEFAKPQGALITLFDLPGAYAMALQGKGATWMIDAGRARNAVQTLIPFLEAEGITHLQGMVVTEKDAAHLGGALALVEKETPAVFFASQGEGTSFLFKNYLKKITASHSAFTSIHAGDRIDFSSDSNEWAEVLYPPANALETALVLKLHLSSITMLLMPSASPLLMTWLLEHSSPEKLHATFLVLPFQEQSLGEGEQVARFITAVAPRMVMLENHSWKGAASARGIFLELSRRLQGTEIKILDQEQTGALIIEPLPKKLRIRSFLNQEILELPEEAGNAPK